MLGSRRGTPWYTERQTTSHAYKHTYCQSESPVNLTSVSLKLLLFCVESEAATVVKPMKKTTLALHFSQYVSRKYLTSLLVKRTMDFVDIHNIFLYLLIFQKTSVSSLLKWHVIHLRWVELPVRGKTHGEGLSIYQQRSVNKLFDYYQAPLRIGWICGCQVLATIFRMWVRSSAHTKANKAMTTSALSNNPNAFFVTVG